MRLELHIDTEGDAFGLEDEDEFRAQHEQARILRTVADEIQDYGYELGGVRTILDVNGNTCGWWRFTDRRPVPRP